MSPPGPLPVATGLGRPVIAGTAYGAEISGSLVVLDVAADRYFLVPRGHPGSSLRRGAGPVQIQRDEAAAGWIARGAVFTTGRVQARAGLRVLFCLHRIANLLEHGSFGSLVDYVRTAPVRARIRETPQDLVTSFEAFRPFFPRPRICRLDAPALCLMMRKHGHPARLFFGARLEPFAAHCWAELAGEVLNEPVQDIAPFRPILAV